MWYILKQLFTSVSVKVVATLYLTNKEALAMYYTVDKTRRAFENTDDGNVENTRYEPQANVLTFLECDEKQ